MKGASLVLIERRAHPRIEASLPIRYRGINRLGMARHGDGCVINISEGGCWSGWHPTGAVYGRD